MYGTRFHTTRDADTDYAAERILSTILERIDVRSVCDVGCGVGTWLRVAKEKGVTEIAGIEGNWLDKSLLVVDPDSVTLRDLRQPIEVSRRYDLALCLEVAEHLPQERAAGLVGDLAKLSDVVLFSAAIPDQGGTEHINEQWQSYWMRLFADAGYDAFDIIRPAIWSDENIPFWYRQNSILYTRRGTLRHAKVGKPIATPENLDIVHPDLYELRLPNSFRSALRMNWKLLKRFLNPITKRRG